MKKLARLILFFSFSFIILLIAGTGLRFLVLKVQWIRYLPAADESPLTLLVSSAHWALSLALFGAILTSLSYTARLKIFAPAAFAGIVILSLVFSFGVSLGLERWSLVPAGHSGAVIPGGAGVIASQGTTSVVLLNGPQDPRGPLVISIADRPLLYRPQAAGPNNTSLVIPPLPLGSDSPWFLKSIAIDLRLNAEQFQSSFAEGAVPFIIYAGALIFFLASLGFLFKLSVWPLANLCVGALVFRLILSFETFINSPEMHDTFASFTGNYIRDSLVVPLIFCVFGVLVIIYSALVYAAKRRKNEDE
ncbi:MAG: hypothetical protein FWF29_03675 [Treponema sp.]|nr:hypothetical protein [Treponema sp.]